ncbi:MAG: prepilin-type N-terminal cleavage/methylation domain-containing protein [Acidiferrobacterales bacterium]
MISGSRKIKNCAGFSLLEVVVAFVVLALVLGVLYQVFSSTARRADLVAQYHHAVLLADSKLTEIAADNRLPAGAATGEFDARYRWESHITPYRWNASTTAEEPGFVPYGITVRVFWQRHNKKRSVTMTTVRVRKAG